MKHFEHTKLPYLRIYSENSVCFKLQFFFFFAKRHILKSNKNSSNCRTRAQFEGKLFSYSIVLFKQIKKISS